MQEKTTLQTKIRVRYQETDNMGVVYYANYLVWFEIARTEYLRSLGISYKNLEKRGFYLMVASAECRYLHPARYDDEVRIESHITKMGRTSLTFTYELFIGNIPIATGRSVHVFTDRSNKPVRIPEEIAGLNPKK